MMKWIKNSKKGMATLVAVAFMLLAGWQFGVGSTEAVFSETEVALENAVEGSGAGTVYCYSESYEVIGFDYYDCGPCEKVSDRRGYGSTLQCQAGG